MYIHIYIYIYVYMQHVPCNARYHFSYIYIYIYIYNIQYTYTQHRRVPAYQSLGICQVAVDQAVKAGVSREVVQDVASE